MPLGDDDFSTFQGGHYGYCQTEGRRTPQHQKGRTRRSKA
jgi:hypothetical protein